jgi:leucyl-tRNA synthetase
MAVPAHDTRDFEFAKEFNIPIICILDPKEVEQREEILAGNKCWTEDGIYINSASQKQGLDINGLNKEGGIQKTIVWLESRQLGKATVNYRMRDWLFSRQRYWGEPFPGNTLGGWRSISLSDEELPLLLPELEKYSPGDSGESPLANAEEWLQVTDKNGRKGRRETNTMPQWAGSCWYYLRYIDPNNEERIFDPEKEKYWMPVDLYIRRRRACCTCICSIQGSGTKYCFDLGIVSTDEPFQKLYNQGMILAFAYETLQEPKVSSDLVEEREGKYFHTKQVRS